MSDRLRIVRPSPTWVHRAEAAYAVVLVALLTQGPVLSIWWRQVQPLFPGPQSAESAILATYLAVQAPAIALLVRRGIGGSSRWAVVGFGAMSALLVLSTVWSSARLVTAPAAISFAATTVAGVYLGSTFRPLTQMVIALVAVQPGLVASQWAVSRRWEGAIDTGHNWVGIYYNRNSLSPPAVIGAAAAIALAVWLVQHRPARWPVAVLGLAAVLWWCIRFQRSARSATSLMALAAFVATFAVWTALAHVPRLRRPGSERLGARLGAGHLALMVISVAAVVALNRPISDLLDRPPGFDGRTTYWAASWDGVRLHPLRGWGWLAAWATPGFRTLLPDSLAAESWSHNAFLDLLLGAGVLVVAPFAVALVAGFRRAGRVALQPDRHGGAWSIALATLVLVAATQESFIIGNHFLWLLGVCALTGAVHVDHRPNEPEPLETLPPRSTPP